MTQQIHPGTELGYVKLKVSRLERSVSFYRDVIGFQVLKRDGKTAEFTVDGKNPLLIIEEIPNAVVLPERSAAGLYHFAILLPNRKQLGMAVKHLLRSGIELGQEITLSARRFTCQTLIKTELKSTGTVHARDGSVMNRGTT